ncbi:hypothetical protein P4U05_05165 [Bacillus paranthracis]|uniref:hypothetical protein n=1 Tax=Bacillus cereus group TaxID=86661 RepID=UPI000200FAFA|nr:hypothetical protein [Bacillus paranthracis]ADY22260.1 hypothetical protein YBT020_15150 [Bacillus thuringiensis serovar finitimus YBT-020]MCW4578130.1 hypothetical protein [Bacillus pacificus]MDA1584900.1 hypothetical protein [Bacillus cereus group sp. TH230-1LC]MRC71090.1 hypothetical protein [Bacillus thuringiensis]OTX69772.1 hypothetical protein BK722_15340 [Bacillus thuringiensis serovar finitimus]
MKSLLQKTLATTGITACLLGMVSSASFASISWDNNATWTGAGSKARATAYTAKSNEPQMYKMTVKATFSDGSTNFAFVDNAQISDRVNLSLSSRGKVSGGYSQHEWSVVDDDSAYAYKEMVIK